MKLNQVVQEKLISFCLSLTRPCDSVSLCTNFAILLSGAGGGKGGQDDPCSSSSQDYTLPYISLGFIAGAICIVLLSIIIIEIRFRLLAMKKKNTLKVTIEYDE